LLCNGLSAQVAERYQYSKIGSILAAPYGTTCAARSLSKGAVHEMLRQRGEQMLGHATRIMQPRMQWQMRITVERANRDENALQVHKECGVKVFVSPKKIGVLRCLDLPGMPPCWTRGYVAEMTTDNPSGSKDGARVQHSSTTSTCMGNVAAYEL